MWPLIAWHVRGVYVLVSRRNIEAVVACSRFYSEMRLKHVEGTDDVPAEVFNLLSGVTSKTTDYSNLLVLEYLAAARLVKRIYGDEGMITFNSVVNAGPNNRPLVSSFTSACRNGYKIIEKEIGEHSRKLIKWYCDRLVKLHKASTGYR